MSETAKTGPKRQSNPPVPPTLNGQAFSDYLEESLVNAGVEIRRFAPGETVFTEGDPGDSAFFIRTGSIDILSHGADGTELLLNHLDRGELFGEMALLDQTQRSASALTREGAELFVVARDEVTTLLQQVPQMALWMLGLFSRRLRVLTRVASQMEQAHQVNLKILAGQEEERRRIGRDIHDGVAQSFAESILRLQTTIPLLDRDVDKARSELEDLENGLRDGLEKIRELIYNLFPKELSRTGLVGAIDKFVDRFAKSSNLAVTFENHGLDEELPAALEATLYCIVQEALSNVRKHARASEVYVDLRRENESLTLAIIDDGSGFDMHAFFAKQADLNTYGLLSMQERAKLAGGVMNVDSRPGAGTRLHFIVPVRPVSARNYEQSAVRC